MQNIFPVERVVAVPQHLSWLLFESWCKQSQTPWEQDPLALAVKQEGAFSHSYLRAVLPACQGVGVLKFWNLVLFPSSTSKQNVFSPFSLPQSQDRQWEAAQPVLAWDSILSRDLMLHTWHSRWISCLLLTSSKKNYCLVCLFLSEIPKNYVKASVLLM